ncbi:hypothetical protein ABB37_04077 [Leptomonas pyrrhocoris]|uniref:Uncharacterized protein n=1 Tax=Leptomonas pyrrhocoris TaxID=157538 RepID=A0A0N0DWG7_LEPPY|nr:hypothetical protein ABB37_04077 [Leptomonas pyrrhocoris]KPA81808.1 hypothetical protein ABB37_04077 [Leptomonas pyrrhocoris]|eukprot:XP_015660247.1 hypothetical protein ABB37_04077 [Leptomonas pyrrhocoris]
MDITKYNQLLALADFTREVKRCDFCAIDQEMTGVDIPGTNLPMGASPDDVYYAKRVAVEAYSAFQMGIALFTKADNNSHEVRPYNFYLLNSTGDLRLGLTAISFLAANNLNFQMWLTSGMAFCNEQEEQAFEAKQDVSFADDEEKSIANEFAAAAQELLSTDGEKVVKELACATDLAQRLQRFIERRSDYRISAAYEGRPYLAQKIKFTLRKLGDTEWAAEKEKKVLQQERERAQVLGFRQFWKILVDSKKPVVGHNFMQDAMFMFHMHQEPLPKNYAQFKQQMLKCMPHIYDTKTIVSKLSGDAAFPITHLGVVYQECRRRAGLSLDTFSRKFRLPPGFYSYNDQTVKMQSKAHEAAYDAYMTGVAFCILHNLYADVTAETENVISAFGSAYYMCLGAADQLVNSNTFVLECDVPCSSEDIESLFFATEDKACVITASNKIDFRKLSYSVNGLIPREDTRVFTAFCVRMTTLTSTDQLRERIQSLREKVLGSDENVNLALLSHITIRKLE